MGDSHRRLPLHVQRNPWKVNPKKTRNHVRIRHATSIHSACAWRSAARSPGRVLPSTWGFTNSAVVPRGIRRRRPGAGERTTNHSQNRNRLRAGFGLLHFPRAVFEAGLKDPKNNNGRCGSARLTRPFRKAPNRCPIRDSSQKERPTLEFFSQER